ncbi:MAG: DUF938 domain-containing protein [Wenzhouxiangella sp.]
MNALSNGPADLPFSPACERNKAPIGEVLQKNLPENAHVLEIGAGTGQHAVYFSQLMPGVNWQSTDVAENVPSLRARFELEAPDRLPPPLALDVRDENWPPGPYDAVFTANTLHIMPYDLAPLLVRGAAAVLVPGGRLICYGPFHDNGVHTAPSNESFDRSLRARDARMGIRDAVEFQRLARSCGLALEADLALPANNRMLLFTRL